METININKGELSSGIALGNDCAKRIFHESGVRDTNRGKCSWKSSLTPLPGGKSQEKGDSRQNLMRTDKRKVKVTQRHGSLAR